MYTIYQAGPLFSEADRNWHTTLSLKLERAGHSVIWPGRLLSAEKIEEAGQNAPKLIFETCRNALENCTAVVALLDGPQVDDGTAWEIGYAYAKGLPIFGIRTDTRQAGDTPYNHVNSMIDACLNICVSNITELLCILEATKKRSLQDETV